MKPRTAIIKKLSGLKFPLFPPFIRSPFISFIGSGWKVLTLALRTLAPLRKIISRELVTFQPDSRVRHFIYSLRDRLECGHEQEHYLFDGLRDLLFAYTENPLMRARRHRCQPCAALAVKKPVQSVAAVAAKGVA